MENRGGLRSLKPKDLEKLFRRLAIGIVVTGLAVSNATEAVARVVSCKGNCENGQGVGRNEVNYGFDGIWKNNQPWTGWMERPDGTTYYIENGQKYVQTEAAKRERERAERRARERRSTSTSCHLENKGYVDSDGRYSGTCSNTDNYVQCGPHYDNRYYCLTDQRGTHYGDTPQEALDGACGCD